MDQLRAFHRLSSQVGILYRQSLVTFIFPVLAVPAVCALLWGMAERGRLLAWAGAVTAFSLGRYLIVWRYGKGKVTLENVNKRLDLFIVCAFVSGLLWGAGMIFLVPYDTARIMEFTVCNSLAMLVVCGLVAGAAVTYSVNKAVIFFYSFPALVPASLHMITLGDRYTGALGGFVVLYFCFIIASSIRLNGLFTYYIDMEYKMLRLTGEFEAYRSRGERAGRMNPVF